MTMSGSSQGKHGVQSFEIGMQVLRVLLAGDRTMMLKDIAAAAGMPPSKVHRYLVSMVRTGLVEQDPASSLYALGPLALEIGLVATDRLDGVGLGLAAIAQLCRQIDEATALATWTRNGPVVVRWERSRRPVAVSVITGSALEMLSTASGRVFGAWLAPSAWSHLVDVQRDAASLPKGLRTRGAIEKMFAQVRRDGMAVVEGGHVSPGVAAIGAPVFDHRGEVALAISVVGIQGMLDTGSDGVPARALLAAAQRLSARLGYRGGVDRGAQAHTDAHASA